MTDQEIIIEVAKLDGFEIIDRGPNLEPWKSKDKGLYSLRDKPYLTSRDAIIPVIERQGRKYLVHTLNQLFSDTKGEYSILATPRQLCIALLKATGKWRGE